MSFFSLWWQGAQPDKRRQVRQLVDEKRLEFTSASWVMTDEASPHLYSMLDQMIEGSYITRVSPFPQNLFKFHIFFPLFFLQVICG